MMPGTSVMQQILDELQRRIELVPDTEHLGFYAGDMPQAQATSLSKPSQEATDSEAGAERFVMEVPINLNAVSDNGDRNHTSNLVALYAAVKLQIFGGDAANIDLTLGDLAELVFESGLMTESSFDIGMMESDAVFTITIQYQTRLGDPYTLA